MNRTEALELAQRKADDWNAEYRVLRCLEYGSERNYIVERSGSLDSPKGFKLVEVFRPRKPCGGQERPSGSKPNSESKTNDR